MSFDALTMLHDEVAELVADARQHHRRAPRVRIEYGLEAGVHTFAVAIDGQVVATGSGASLDRAARQCREAFLAWHEDQPAAIAHALDVSVQRAHAERAAGGSR